MKLRNKKTGEIGLVHCDATMFSNEIGVFIDNNHIDLRNPYKIYTSLAELNAEWEDYEEPKGSALNLMILTLINFIENEPDEDKVDLEDCEQMLEKLKAWKRLKDKGFRFVEWQQHGITEDGVMDGAVYFEDAKNIDRADLNLLFGGEE